MNLIKKKQNLKKVITYNSDKTNFSLSNIIENKKHNLEFNQ